MKAVADFDQCLEESERFLASKDMEQIFRTCFPKFVCCRKAYRYEDREGTDYFAYTKQGAAEIDIKVLSHDPGRRSGWNSCLPIELWSVKDRWICGYQGRADFILWLYRDSNRIVLARRKELFDYVNARRLEWMIFLDERESRTRLWNGTQYTSSFVWLPFFVVEKQDFFYQFKVA